jgi:dolichol-phosphate mannosyltransferase
MNGAAQCDELPAANSAFLPPELAGQLVPVRFLLFAMIGGFGVLTHLATLWFTVSASGTGFAAGQALATIVAMTGNFLLNNLFTYRDRRLRGRALIAGLLSFYAVCGIGALANVGIASRLFAADHSWWLAGLGGAAVGAVWNYAASSVLIWRSRTTVPAARPLQPSPAPHRHSLNPSAA